MDGTLLNSFLILLFILIGGFFAASEIALVSLRGSQVRAMSGKGKRGEKVAKLHGDSNRFLSSVQIGVTVAGFFASAFGGATLAVQLQPVLVEWGVPEGLASTLALVLITIVISYFSLVLGELVPKRLALQKSESVSLFVAPVLDRIAGVTRPIIWLLSHSTNLVVRLFGLDPRQQNEEVSEEELREMVSTHRQLTAEERRVLVDVFEATDRTVNEVMVPRTEVAFLESTVPLAEAAREIIDRPHSRYPVIGDSADDVIGFVHVRDVLTAVQRGAQGLRVGDLVREIALLPGSKELLPALSQLRSSGSHLAVVVDEYGGTDGIVTLEDLVEELVGEIQDEYDPDLRPERASRPGILEVDGALRQDEVAEAAGFELPEGPYSTLAGFLLHRLGRIPEPGASTQALERRFTVTEMDGRRITRIRIETMPEPKDGADAGGPAEQPKGRSAAEAPRTDSGGPAARAPKDKPENS
ncbi:hemolysin family protein [Actinoalloteichus hymeniacidonis]|uniref:CBS domain-containing protein n=1 Tax=Actinoalloteichus hymeniacidonis TaxID=340345 RepID=A0AAC9HUF8_9PSEU|nr:hemolysin family protein [Actinoalloteichus hymeniacidonis]AOS65351.1 CBS domain-containing protein [Actinoalloteichus hymeniacidonis]MBB5906563.1 putative hemolysin [Actinoalloteichus hymeniacidonis]